MKKSLKEVKNIFRQNGCKLLENKYVNATIKMHYRCVCGRESHINLNNFSQGKRCGCRRRLDRISEDDIKSEVESKGFIYLSSEKINGIHVVECICKCGNKRKCQLNGLRKAKAGCKKCLSKYYAFKIEDVKKIFEEQGCELLENSYTNARKLLKYKCVCENESKITLYSFKSGNRCKKCGSKKISEKVSGSNHPNWNPNRKEAKENIIFRKKCCSLLKNTLNRIGQEKDDKTKIMLGYDSRQLKEHIFSHPNWNNLKNKKWHIDHIFPIKAFLDHGIRDIKLINCLDNLQPMLAEDNLTKHANYSKIDFELWLQTRKEAKSENRNSRI